MNEASSMTEPQHEASEAPAAHSTPTAGAMLRQARQAQGLHIVALAAAIKVAPRKLELLESDRFDELLDATFARALAQTVCRVLKIDAEPVLAKLPAASGHGLDRVAGGINAPFRERSARSEPASWSLLKKPTVWGPLLILLGAAALWLLPKGMGTSGRQPAPAASAPAVALATAPPAVVETAPSPQDVAPVVAAAKPSSGEALAATPSALTLRTSGQSWVEVIDARGQPLLSRLLQPGESVGIEGAAPLRVIIGNVAVTQMSFRGQPVDLKTSARDNVARLELK
jgi:cytoskeleton protein RodZ